MLRHKVWGQAEMKCENCKFWEEKKKVEPGRIAPQLVEMTLWPQVSANNWCGELKELTTRIPERKLQ